MSKTVNYKEWAMVVIDLSHKWIKRVIMLKLKRSIKKYSCFDNSLYRGVQLTREIWFIRTFVWEKFQLIYCDIFGWCNLLHTSFT